MRKGTGTHSRCRMPASETYRGWQTFLMAHKHIKVSTNRVPFHIREDHIHPLTSLPACSDLTIAGGTRWTCPARTSHCKTLHPDHYTPDCVLFCHSLWAISVFWAGAVASVLQHTTHEPKSFLQLGTCSKEHWRIGKSSWCRKVQKVQDQQERRKAPDSVA